MAVGEISVKINDFSGGVADFPLDPEQHTHAKLDNFVITDEKKAQVCKGSNLVDPSLDQEVFVHPHGQTNDIFFTNISSKDKLFVRVKDKLFTMDDETLEIFDDSAKPIFYTGGLPLTKDSVGSFEEADDHVYAVAAEKMEDYVGASPIKIYRKTTDEFAAYNAGMPEIQNDPLLLTKMLALANEIKAAWNLHVAISDHSSSSGAVTASDATDEQTLGELLQDIRDKYIVHFAFYGSGLLGSGGPSQYHKLAVQAGERSLNKVGIASLDFPYYAQTFMPPDISNTTYTSENLISALNALKNIFNLHLTDVCANEVIATYETKFYWLHPSDQTAGVFASEITTADIRKTTDFVLPAVFNDVVQGNFSTGLIDHFKDTTAHTNDFFPESAGSPDKIYKDTYYGQDLLATEIDVIKMVYQSLYFYLIHVMQKSNFYHTGNAGPAAENPAVLLDTLKAGIYPDFNETFGKDLAYLILSSINFTGAALAVHAGGTPQHGTAVALTALYTLATPNFVTPSYAFLFSRTYTKFSGEKLVDRGAPYIFTGKAKNESLTDPLLSGIYAFYVLPDEENWPVDEMTVEIYRQAFAGAGYFFIGSIPYNATLFPTKLFQVSKTNADLITQPQLYTDDGNAPNGQPPKCFALKKVGFHMYYGGVLEKDDAGVLRLTNNIYQSKNSNWDAVPGDFFVKSPRPFVCMGKVRENLIVITSKGIHRADGTFTDVGAGGIVLNEIHATAGGVSFMGAVDAGDLCFFAGKDGFYMTDGYKVKLISRHLRDKYKKIVALDANGLSKGRLIKGAYHPQEKRIYWCVAENSDNYDAVWILDLAQPVSDVNESACFTMRYGNSIRPSAIAVWNELNLVRGDVDGWVFMEDEAIYSDPDINRADGSLTGARRHIEYNLLTGLEDFGDNKSKKYGAHTTLDLKANGEPQLSVVPYFVNDNGRNTGELHEINYNSANGDPLGFVHAQRKISSGGLRFHSRQLGLKPDSIKLYSSPDYANATIVAGLILEIPGGIVWPTDVVGCTVYMLSDGYVSGYPIIERLSDTQIKVSDEPGTIPPPGTITGWVIEGFPKNERLEVLSLDMMASPIGIRRSGYSTGENKAQ